MPAQTDSIDALHGAIALDEALSVQQARAEGLLDPQVARVVEGLGRGDPDLDPVRVAIVLNCVGRTLRDAYGPATYREGLMLAQRDLYEEGEIEGMRQLRDDALRQIELVRDAASKAMDEVTADLPALARSHALSGLAAGFLGAMTAFGLLAGVLWHVGAIALP